MALSAEQIWRHHMAAGPAATTVTLAGELDMSATAELRCLLRDAIRADSAVHVDLSEVAFIDSTAIGVMMSARSEAGAAGCGFRVVNTSERVRRVLTLTGVLDVLTADGPG